MRLPILSFLLTICCTAIPADAERGHFTPGESTSYEISWLGMTLARSHTTTEMVSIDGRDLIQIRMESKSVGAYSYIYNVDDITEVLIDPKTSLPIKVDVIINEGSKHKSHITTFYHDQKVAVFQDRITHDISEIPIEADTQDLFSFIFSKRDEDLNALASKTHKICTAGKVYDLELRIADEDKVKLPHYGKVASIEIEPIAEFDGLFLRQGKIFFWVSKHNPRMITSIQAKVPVGKITARLERVSGSGSDFWDKNQEKQ